MLLVGDFYDNESQFQDLEFKSEISREDLAKAKENSRHYVIDIANQKFFNPESNEWTPIKNQQ